MVVFKLNGVEVPTGPTQWEELDVLASFNDEEINAVVEIDDVTFSGDEAKQINSWTEDGLSGTRGLYQGMPFSMELREKGQAASVFEGYLNFKEGYINHFNGKVSTKISANEDLLTLEERLQSINFGSLQSQGFITSADFINEPYLVQKVDARLEFMMLAFATYMTLKETIEGVQRIGRGIVDISKGVIPNTGFPSIDTGDLIGAAILLALDAAYVAFMIIYLINLVRDLIDFIYPPLRSHKGMRILTMLQKAAAKLGYGFVTDIQELSVMTYIPSRPEEENKKEKLKLGIPRPEDRGYNCAEIFNIVEDMFKAKKTIVGNDIVLNAEIGDYWLKKSVYVMHDVLHEKKEFNVNELVGSKLLSFEKDASNSWSSIDYRGTSYSISTSSKKDSGHELIDGFRRVDFGVGIASRKDGLDDLEKAIKVTAQLIDGLINRFGGKSNIAGKIKNRVGVMKQSERTHNLARIVHHTNGKVSTRDQFSAKYLYHNYHVYTSFVENDFFGQKRLFNEVEIKFCLADFINTVKNSYFTTHDGRVGKFTELKYTFSKDKAVASFWIREVHSKNLIEEYYEPE